MPAKNPRRNAPVWLGSIFLLGVFQGCAGSASPPSCGPDQTSVDGLCQPACGSSGTCTSSSSSGAASLASSTSSVTTGSSSAGANSAAATSMGATSAPPSSTPAPSSAGPVSSSAVGIISSSAAPSSGSSAATPSSSYPFAYRANVGGAALTGIQQWEGTTTGARMVFSPSRPAYDSGPFLQNTGDDVTLAATGLWWDASLGEAAAASLSSLASGEYRVRFMVGEAVWMQAGARKFGFVAEGITLSSTIDPYALAGARHVGIWLDFDGIMVSDGELNLTWLAVVDNPEIRAIEVLGSVGPVHGACGAANGVPTSQAPLLGLCAAGAATPVTGSGPWSWMCSGLNGGTAAPCSATATQPELPEILPLEVGDSVFVSTLSYYPRTAAGSSTRVNSTGYQGGSAMGSIVGGPVTVGGVTWWNVDFAQGTDGWVPESTLRRVSDAGLYYAAPAPLIPGVILNVSQYSVPPGGTTTLTWEARHAVSCASSWGSSATQGTFVTPPLSQVTTYTISCTDGVTMSPTRTAVIAMGFAKPKVALWNYGVVNTAEAQAAMAKYNLATLGYTGSITQTQTIMANIKALNPNIKLAKYLLLVEGRVIGADSEYPTINVEVETNNWWLRNVAGDLLTWTTQYGTYEYNITAWAGKNAWGDGLPQLTAKVHARDLYRHVPILEYVFMDNFFSDSINGQQIPANWKLDGVDRTILPATVSGTAYPGDPEVGSEFRKGYMDYVATFREEAPGVQFMGNGGDGVNDSAVEGLGSPEYRNQWEGNFMECVIGKGYSRETWRSTTTNPVNVGWNEVMARYRKAMANTKAPHDVFFHVCRGADPARPETMLPERDMMRYGLASTLLDDGWFVYHGGAYGAPVAWYDEFDAPMGKPTQAPPLTPTYPEGVWTRTYEGGMAVVNPRKDTALTVTIPPGYKHLLGTQDPTLNNGQPVTTLTMAPRSGVLLLRE